MKTVVCTKTKRNESEKEKKECGGKREGEERKGTVPSMEEYIGVCGKREVSSGNSGVGRESRKGSSGQRRGTEWSLEAMGKELRKGEKGKSVGGKE